MDAPKENSVLLSSATYSDFLRLKSMWEELQNVSAEKESTWSNESFTRWLLSLGNESVQRIQKHQKPSVQNHEKKSKLNNNKCLNERGEVMENLKSLHGGEYEYDTLVSKGTEEQGHVKKHQITLKTLSHNDNTETMRNSIVTNHRCVLQNMLQQTQDTCHANDDLLDPATCSYGNIESNMKNYSLTKLSDLMGDDDDADCNVCKDGTPLQFQENSEYNPMFATYEEFALENSLEGESEISSILDSEQICSMEDLLPLLQPPSSDSSCKSITNDNTLEEDIQPPSSDSTCKSITNDYTLEEDIKEKQKTNSTNKYHNAGTTKCCEKWKLPVPSNTKIRTSSDMKQANKMTGDKVSASHRCNVCSKVFTTHKSVRRHFLRVHKNGKLHKCPDCEYSTAYAPYLSVHRERHKQIARHACALCPRAFMVNADLARHVRTIHSSSTGGMPDGGVANQCHVCGRGFSRKDALSVHIRTVHDGGCGRGCVGKTHVADPEASNGNGNSLIDGVGENHENNDSHPVICDDSDSILRTETIVNDEKYTSIGENNRSIHGRVTGGYLVGSASTERGTVNDGINPNTGNATVGTVYNTCQTRAGETLPDNISHEERAAADEHITESHLPVCSQANASIRSGEAFEPCKRIQYLVGTGTDDQFQSIANGYFENPNSRHTFIRCESAFDDYSIMKGAKDCVKPQPPMDFTCPICQRAFVNHQGLSLHVKHLHSDTGGSTKPRFGQAASVSTHTNGSAFS